MSDETSTAVAENRKKLLGMDIPTGSTAPTSMKTPDKYSIKLRTKVPRRESRRRRMARILKETLVGKVTFASVALIEDSIQNLPFRKIIE